MFSVDSPNFLWQLSESDFYAIIWLADEAPGKGIQKEKKGEAKRRPQAKIFTV